MPQKMGAGLASQAEPGNEGTGFFYFRAEKRPGFPNGKSGRWVVIAILLQFGIELESILAVIAVAEVFGGRF